MSELEFKLNLRTTSALCQVRFMSNRNSFAYLWEWQRLGVSRCTRTIPIEPMLLSYTGSIRTSCCSSQCLLWLYGWSDAMWLWRTTFIFASRFTCARCILASFVEYRFWTK